MNNMDKQPKKYIKDRDKAILSFDIEQMKKFYKKYRSILPPIPQNEILYAGMMKAVADIRAATPEQKKRAADWLRAHGYSERCF